ncbi:MAG: SRPBCC family protein [Chloroflexi bacterium]|nr:SRPBCC family protein [Chloroflexota bacterium]MDA1148298.1 SRPBCC family protein [Chloroflexota bacterium]
MPQYTTTVQSVWPVERAFVYMADLRNFERWDPGVKAARQASGNGPGPDSTFDVTVGGVLRDIVLRYEMLEYQPPHRVVVRARNRALESLDAIDVRPTEAGSEIVYSAALDFRGVYRPLNPLLALVFKRIVERAARGLQEVVAQSEP